MPRITITTDAPGSNTDAVILLDERIHAIHISTPHASSQLIERLAWAVSDAEDIEIEQHALAASPVRLERRNARRQAPSSRPPARQAANA
jgi:hypothetical protein